MRILLVDGEAAQLAATARLLRSAGFDVLEATTGTECLQAAKRCRPDLVLLDAALPDLDGHQVCRELKADPALEGTFVALMFGEGKDADDTADGGDVGADGYITRPIENRELLARVRAFQRVRQAEAEAIQAKKEWERTFDAVPDMVFVLDNEHRIVRANRIAAERLGCAPHDLIGRRCYEALHGTEAPPESCPHAQLLADGREHHAELHLDGLGGDFSVSVMPLRDTDGELTGAVHVAHDITEGKRAEEALRKSQRELAKAQSIAHIGNWEWNVTTGKVTWSDEIFRLFGLDRQEPSYGLAKALTHPEDTAFWERSVNEALYEGKPFSIDYRAIRPDGSVVWIHNEAEVVRDEHGNALRMFGTAQDVTSRKEAERRLQESETKHRTLIEQIPAVTYVAALDEASTTLFISPQVEGILGFRPDEWKEGRNIWLDQLHPEDRGRVLSEVNASHASGDPFSSEYRMITRDGCVVWIADHAVVVRDGEGKPVFLQGVMFDISGRKRAEEALRRAHEELNQRRALVLACSLDGLWEWDIASHTVQYSDRFAELLGYAPDEVPGTLDFFRGVLHPDDAETTWAAVDRHLQGRTPYEVECRLRSKWGEYRWFQARGQAQWDAAGKPVRMAGSIQDITDRKRAEEAREERLRFERLLSELSARFVNVSADDLDGEIQAGLRKILEFFEVDRCGIFEYSADKSQLQLAWAAYAAGVSTVPERIDISQFYPWALPRILEGAPFILESLDDLPPEASAERRRLEASDTASAVTLPLRVGGSVRYLISLTTVGRQRRWPDDLLPGIQLLGEVFVNALTHCRDDEAVRQAELKYRTVADFAYDWVYWAEPDGEYRYMTPSCERITGYKPQEFRASPSLLRDVVLSEDRPIWDEHHRECHEGKTPGQLQFRICRRDGQVVWLEHVCQPVVEENGRFLGIRAGNRDINDRKQMEESLRESEKRLAYALEASVGGVWDWNVKTGKVYYSPRWIESLGYLPEEVPPHVSFWQSLVHPDDMPRVEEVLRAHFEGRTPSYEVENRLRKKSGEYRWNLDRGKVVERDADGKPLRMVGTDTDITERKQAEEALGQSEAFLKTVLASLRDHVAVVDRQGKILAVNDAWLQFARDNDLKRFDCALPGADYLEICRLAADAGNREAKTALDGIRAVLDWRKPRFGMEYECSSDDAERWFSMSVMPLLRPEGGAVITHTDITRRRVAEEQARQRAQRLAEAQSIAHLGSWAWNTVTNEIVWSDEVYRVFGLEPEQFGATYEAFLNSVHPDDRRAVGQAVQASLADPSVPYSIEHRVVRPEGAVRVVHERASVTFDEGGRPVRMIGTVQDITDRKRAEAESQRLRDDLAHVSRVAALGQLAAAIAHEINQPLAAILSNAQAAQRFLAGEELNLEEVREALRDIVEDDRRAGEVIRRLRSMLRRGEAERKPLDVNEMIREVISMIRGELAIRDLDLTFDPADELPAVLGDRVQLQQVVLNLVGNALEAITDTPRSLRKITIRTRREASGVVAVSVRDAGPPISEEAFASLFDPFYTTKPDGLGIGLSISRSIVEAHGGRIWAERNADRGLNIHFTLSCSPRTDTTS